MVDTQISIQPEFDELNFKADSSIVKTLAPDGSTLIDDLFNNIRENSPFYSII